MVEVDKSTQMEDFMKGKLVEILDLFTFKVSGSTMYKILEGDLSISMEIYTKVNGKTIKPMVLENICIQTDRHISENGKMINNMVMV